MSFSVNIDSLLSTASQLFNVIFPMAAVGIGITLGVGLVRFVSKAIADVF